MPLRETTLGGLLPESDPAIPGKTVFFFSAGKAAEKTGCLFYTFGAGVPERSCAFMPYWKEFMTDLQAALQETVRHNLAFPFPLSSFSPLSQSRLYCLLGPSAADGHVRRAVMTRELMPKVMRVLVAEFVVAIYYMLPQEFHTCKGWGSHMQRSVPHEACRLTCSSGQCGAGRVFGDVVVEWKRMYKPVKCVQLVKIENGWCCHNAFSPVCFH